MGKALVVIDIQEDYTGATARPPFPYKDSEKFIITVNKLIDEFSENNCDIIYVRQEFKGFSGKLFSKLAGHGTAISGSEGAQFDKRINIVSENCFTKPMPDAFSNPDFVKLLQDKKIDELYLAGLDAEGCVYFTAKGALKHGCKVSIIKQGVLLLKTENWDRILKKYEQDGIRLI